MHSTKVVFEGRGGTPNKKKASKNVEPKTYPLQTFSETLVNYTKFIAIPT